MLANDVIFGRSRFPGPLITQIRPLIMLARRCQYCQMVRIQSRLGCRYFSYSSKISCTLTAILKKYFMEGTRSTTQPGKIIHLTARLTWNLVLTC